VPLNPKKFNDLMVVAIIVAGGVLWRSDQISSSCLGIVLKKLANLYSGTLQGSLKNT